MGNNSYWPPSNQLLLLNTNNNIKQPVSLVPAEFFGGSPGEFAELSFGTKQTIRWLCYIVSDCYFLTDPIHVRSSVY